MKKVLVLLLTLTLTLSMSLCAFAASDKGNNGKGNGANKTEAQASSTSDTAATAASGSLWYNKSGNLAKLYTEDGKKVMFPVHALLNNGAMAVIWSDEDGTVTVTGSNGITVVFTPNSTTATTQASVALGDTTGALQFTLDTSSDPLAIITTGTIGGTVPATITDPLTGNPISVSLTIAGTVSGYDSATLDGSISNGTFSGDYIDAITGQVTTISGTITGLLSDPEYAFNEDSGAIDFAIPFENEISNGRAYVPIQDLDKLFATEMVTTADAAAEPAAETEVPTV